MNTHSKMSHKIHIKNKNKNVVPKKSKGSAQGLGFGYRLEVTGDDITSRRAACMMQMSCIGMGLKPIKRDISISID